MIRSVVCWLGLACFAAFATACAGDGGRMDAAGNAPAMSTSDFYALCSALPVPGGCLSDPICQRYRRELSEPPAELAACLSLCRQTAGDLYTANLTNGCAGVLDRAEDLCDQFCRRREGN